MHKHEPIRLRTTRDFGGSISVTFDFLRENFKPLYKSLLLIAGGIMVLSYTIGFLVNTLLETGSTYNEPFAENTENMGMPPVFGGLNNDFLASNSILIYIVFFISTLVVIAITYRYLLLYPKYGKNISPSLLWLHMRKDLWKILVATFVFYIILALGVVAIGTTAAAMGWFVAVLSFCVLMYIIIPLSLMHIIILAENINPIAAIKRSLYLIKDNWWSTFGVIFITSLIIYVISMVIYLPATIVAGAVSYNSLEGLGSAAESNELMTAFTIAMTMIYSMSFFFSLPVSYLALGFQYFSIVESKEHIGLIEKIKTIGEKQL